MSWKKATKLFHIIRMASWKGFLHYWPSIGGNSPVTNGFPTKKLSNAELVFVRPSHFWGFRAFMDKPLRRLTRKCGGWTKKLELPPFTIFSHMILSVLRRSFIIEINRWTNILAIFETKLPRPDDDSFPSENKFSYKNHKLFSLTMNFSFFPP